MTEKHDFVNLTGHCPYCGSDLNINQNYPAPDKSWCNSCKESFPHGIKIRVYPSKTEKCPECESNVFDYYPVGFGFFDRLVCQKCKLIFFRLHPTIGPGKYIMTAKEAKSRRELGSYQKYKGGFLASIYGRRLPRWSPEEKLLRIIMPTEKVEKKSEEGTEKGEGREKDIIITPSPREARHRLKRLAYTEKFGVSYTKTERKQREFERWIEPQIERSLCQNVNDTIIEDVKNLAKKMWVYINKKGRDPDYVLLSIFWIAFKKHGLILSPQSCWDGLKLGPPKNFVEKTFWNNVAWAVEQLKIEPRRDVKAQIRRLKSFAE